MYCSPFAKLSVFLWNDLVNDSSLIRAQIRKKNYLFYRFKYDILLELFATHGYFLLAHHNIIIQDVLLPWNVALQFLFFKTNTSINTKILWESSVLKIAKCGKKEYNKEKTERINNIVTMYWYQKALWDWVWNCIHQLASLFVALK